MRVVWSALQNNWGQDELPLLFEEALAVTLEEENQEES